MPIMVERSLFRTGEDSLAVTLPKAWVREHLLRPKDTVGVIISDDGHLIVRPVQKNNGQQKRNTTGLYRLRFMILRRDNFRCQYCGRSPKEDGVKLAVDHIVPVSKGGTDEPENLLTSCTDCNRGKGALLLNDV